MFIDIFKNVKKEIKDLLDEYNYENLTEPEKQVMDKIAGEYGSIRNSVDVDYKRPLDKSEARSYAGEIALCSVLNNYVENQSPENQQKIDFLLNKFEVDVNLTHYNAYMADYEDALGLAIKSKDNKLVEDFIERGLTTDKESDLKYFEEHNISYKPTEDYGINL